jgi:hypothetical protein
LIAKHVLVGIGLLFVVNGLIIGGLRLAQVIPASYGWLAPLFLALGAVGPTPQRPSRVSRGGARKPTADTPRRST